MSGGCTLTGAACTPDPTTVAINGWDPGCDSSYCGNVVAPPLGEDPCISLVGDVTSYDQCENALENKLTGAPPPPPLGGTSNPFDRAFQGYRGPTSLGGLVGQIPLTIKLPVGAILLVIAAVAFAPYVGLAQRAEAH